MDIYKGINRGQSKEIFYWLDNYCKDQRPHILNNDIELQKRVKRYRRKETLKVLLFNVAIWAIAVTAVYYLKKGY